MLLIYTKCVGHHNAKTNTNIINKTVDALFCIMPDSLSLFDSRNILLLYILTCTLCTEWACTSTTGISASQRSHPHTTTNKHRIIQCYRYLLVDCVQKGPVHPLLELPPPKDQIPIPLPINIGLYSAIDTYL